MKKIRLVHIVPHLGIGGVQRVVLDLCDTADRTQFDIHIIILQDDRTLVAQYDLPNDITITCVPYEASMGYSFFAYWKYYKLPFVQSSFIGRLKLVLETIQPDIIDVHVNLKELFMLKRLKGAIPAKWVYTQHLVSMNGASRGMNALRKLMRKNLLGVPIIAVSNAVKEDLERAGIWSDKRCRLIENRLNAKRFRVLDSSFQTKKYITYLARISAVKDHTTLLHAWKTIESEYPQYQLLLIGPDDMHGAMHQLTQDLGLTDRVVFAGSVNDSAAYMQSSVIGVFPSTREGLPIGLLEQMAWKIPMVVSDIPELTHILQHEQNGLVFNCGNKSELSKQMKRLLNDPVLQQKLSTNAFELVMRHYASERLAHAHESFFKEILQEFS